MALELGTYFWVPEYYEEDYPNDDLGLTLTFLRQGQIWKMLIRRITWTYLKILAYK